MIANCIYGQEWIRVFGIPDDAKAFAVVESYDHGYLIGGHYRHNNYLWYYGWLLKTDINGTLLWDIKIGNQEGTYGTIISGMEPTIDGGLIISGSTYLFNNSDGFILKVDACGQKEWCNIYKSPGNMDYSTRVYPLTEGGYIMNFAYWGYDLANKRIWLFRLDEEGNTLWQNLYGTDPGYINEHAHDMIITPDSGYLLTGFNWIEIDTMPGYYYEHPFFIKVNKEGEEEWEHTYFPEIGFNQGAAESAICDNNGNIYSSGYKGNYDEPSMIKVSTSGEPIGHVVIMDSIYYGITSTINWLSDSSLVLGGYHGHANGLGTTIIWKVDKNGNKLKERDSLLVNVSSPYDAITTFDDKVVFVVTTPYYNPESLDIVMYKLNSDLEYDSMFTQPFVYDYLCPDTIVSDTIPMDCDIITNLDQQLHEPVPSLVIKPNPATNKVIIELPEYNKTEASQNGITSTKIRYLSHMETALDVYDMMGRFVIRIIVLKGEMEVEIDVSVWDRGIYFLRLSADNMELSTGKLLLN